MTARQLSLASDVGRLLREGKLAATKTRCVCGQDAADEVIADVDRYGLPLRTVLCTGCGTLRADPYFDEPSLKHFYTDFYQDLYARAPEPRTYFETQKRYGGRVLNAIKAVAAGSSLVVEVGCGAGGALAALQEAGLEVAGCDHSERLVQFGTSVGLSKLTVGSIEDLSRAHPELVDIDVIYLHHVFEHVSDPAAFLQACKGLLRSTGVMIAIVPDVSRIDRFPFPRGDVRLFLHLAHKYNYSRQGLQLLGENNGYEVVFVGEHESNNAPELWVVFRSSAGVRTVPDRRHCGDQMLRYLRRTELLYRLGILPGYQPGRFPRLRRMARAVLPAGTGAWLRSVRQGWHGSGGSKNG